MRISSVNIIKSFKMIMLEATRSILEKVWVDRGNELYNNTFIVSPIDS